MAEVINLRQQEDRRANANRLAFGQTKHVRKIEASNQAKARRHLDRHRVETGDQQ